MIIGLSDILKKLRKENHITQEVLAVKIGVERSSIGKYEASGVIPSIDVLIKIADYFHVTLDYLLGRETSGNLSRADETPLTGKELAFISAYRNNPAMQGAVDKLLGIPAEPENNIADDVVSELNTPLFVQK